MLKHSKGWILVQMLILSALVALMVLAMLESNFMQAKMNRYFKAILAVKRAVLLKLTALESTLSDACQQMSWPLVQFVPDTLHENERNGLYYFKLNAEEQGEANKQLESIFAVRCQPKEEVMPMQHSFSAYKPKYARIAILPNESIRVAYIIDEQNQLLKFMPDLGQDWHLENAICLPGNGLALWVGRAPHEGAYIYVLLKDQFNQHIILTLWDNFKQAYKTMYSIPLGELLASPVLRSDYLIIAARKQVEQIDVYSAWDGQWLRNCKIELGTCHDKTTDLMALQIHELKLASWVEVNYCGFKAGCALDIEPDRLGRSVLRETNA